MSRQRADVPEGNPGPAGRCCPGDMRTYIEGGLALPILVTHGQMGACGSSFEDCPEDLKDRLDQLYTDACRALHRKEQPNEDRQDPGRAS